MNDGVSGAAYASQASAGGWIKYLQQYAQQGIGAVAGSGVTTTGLHGISRQNGLHVCFWGINDLTQQGNTAAALAGLKSAFRTIISRLRSAIVVEESNAMFAFTGAWSTLTSAAENSGATYKYTSTNGNYVTITLPSDWPAASEGGYLCLGTTARSPGAGAIHTVTVNGVQATVNGVAGPYDGHQTQNQGYEAHCLRIPNPGPGAVIVDTLSSITTLASIDYIQYEPAESDCPLIVMCLQPYPIDWTAYNPITGTNVAPTNAGVDALNQILRDLATEFGKHVITADCTGMAGDSTMFMSDNLHPSNKGHRYIAEQVRAALKNQLFAVSYKPPNARIFYQATAVAPTGTSRYYYVGDIIRAIAPAPGQPSEIVCTTAGKPGTWTTTVTAAKTGTATLVAGTKAVADTAITANSVIRVSTLTPGGTVGAPYIASKTAGTGFTITSTSASDTSVVQYWIDQY